MKNMDSEELKRVVKEKYSKVVLSTQSGGCSCGCTPNGGCCGTEELSSFGESYENIEGYVAEADYGLGCGIPTQFAGINKGDRVLDLGSGAGNDCFVAASIVGADGLVTGLDFTESMIEKARENSKKRGYINVEFVKGDIEDMPLPSDYYNVVISNCVLNLVPDKNITFSNIKRVLKKGGHFCVSDVVTKDDLPEELRKDAELYAGCVAGACEINDYLNIIKMAGFTDVTIHKEVKIDLPAEIVNKYFTASEQEAQKRDKGIFSITVTGWK